MDGKGRHGFLLAVLSPRLHQAVPNNALKEFAEHVRSLFTTKGKPDPVGNDVVYEWLYLKNPTNDQFYKFRVILDFFASAGDGRWWHDHRFPGGIAFTFNSLGHMTRTREWYEKNASPLEWAAKLAMLTISNAFPHPVHGQATSLLDLSSSLNKPVGCPFADSKALPDRIKEKDWTTYVGFHHTDHSVRAEFFDGREAPDRSRGPHLLDFSYIAGNREKENVELMEGIVVQEEEVLKDIGRIEERRFAKPLAKTRPGRPRIEETKIKAALRKFRKWLQTPSSIE